MAIQSNNKQNNRTIVRTKAVALINCRYGYFAYHLHDRVIGRSLEQYGEWAEHEIMLFSQILKSGNFVIDVGANIGTHTVPMAQMVSPKGIVYAFEPQRLTYQLLCTNVALNSLNNVFTHLAGVSDTPGTAKIPVIQFGRPANIGNLNIEGHGTGESVPIMKLDQMEIPGLDFIKIDVEGMELQVLSGAINTLKKYRPVLFVENNIAENSNKLINTIINLDYQCLWHIADYYNPNNFFQNPNNIFDIINRPEINLLCIPTEKKLNINSLPSVLGPEDTWQAALQRLNRK